MDQPEQQGLKNNLSSLTVSTVRVVELLNHRNPSNYLVFVNVFSVLDFQAPSSAAIIKPSSIMDPPEQQGFKNNLSLLPVSAVRVIEPVNHRYPSKPPAFSNSLTSVFDLQAPSSVAHTKPSGMIDQPE